MRWKFVKLFLLLKLRTQNQENLYFNEVFTTSLCQCFTVLLMVTISQYILVSKLSFLFNDHFLQVLGLLQVF